MKTKYVAATIYAAVCLTASCNLFSNKKKAGEQLAGEYEIINMSDSPVTNEWMPGDSLKWFFNTVKDSSHLYVNFVNDSLLLFKTAGTADSLKYYKDSATKTFNVKTDSSYHPYTIIQQSDSLVTFLATEDSLYVLLRKR